MHGLKARCDGCPSHQRGICSVLEPSTLTELFRISRRKIIPAHNVIFRDGDASDYYYNITTGIVKLVKTLADGEQHIVGLLFPGEFLGQSLNPRHTYSAEAATDVDLCAFPKPPFESFLKLHPELERHIFEMTVRELDVCRDWTLLLGRKCSYERVAGFLLMMAWRMPDMGAGQRSGNSAQFELPFTRAELADYLGLTLETVSRQFSHLKNKRVIGLPSSRHVTIPDVELLSAVAKMESCSASLDEGQSTAFG
jgi:CRP/FNR family transcriptional regulator